MHRNTFINSPELLRPTLQYKDRDDLLFAGQMTGVEGYIESAASGLVAGVNAAYLAKGEKSSDFPRTNSSWFYVQIYYFCCSKTFSAYEC